jgi:hypothetical protein
MLEEFTKTVKMRIHFIQHVDAQYVFIKLYDDLDEVKISHLFTNNKSHIKHTSQKTEEEFEEFVEQITHEFDYLTRDVFYEIEIIINDKIDQTTTLYNTYRSLYNRIKEKNVTIKHAY